MAAPTWEEFRDYFLQPIQTAFANAAVWHRSLKSGIDSANNSGNVYLAIQRIAMGHENIANDYDRISALIYNIRVRGFPSSGGSSEDVSGVKHLKKWLDAASEAG